MKGKKSKDLRNRPKWQTVVALSLAGVFAVAIALVFTVNSTSQAAVQFISGHGKLIRYASTHDFASQVAAHLLSWTIASELRLGVMLPPLSTMLNRTATSGPRAFVPSDWCFSFDDFGAAHRRKGLEVRNTDWSRVQLATPKQQSAWGTAYPWELDELAEAVTFPLYTGVQGMPTSNAVLQRISKAVKASSPGTTIDIGNPFPIAELTPAHRHVLRDVAKGLRFSDNLEQLAHSVYVGALNASGGLEYNSLHFGGNACGQKVPKAEDIDTILKGAMDFARSMGLMEPQHPIYVSTAIPGLQDIVAERLVANKLCPAVFTRTSFVDRRFLDMLPYESVEAVDFLVHTRAKNFVGQGCSTFSFLVDQYRQLEGGALAQLEPMNGSVLLPHPWLGVLNAALAFTPQASER